MMHRPLDFDDDEATWPGRNRATRVLVAEDDDDLRMLMGAILRLDGHSVTEVRSGNELLSTLSTPEGMNAGPDGGFHLVVTDVRMPGFSGLDVVERMRNCGCSTPVIAVTSFPDAGLHRLADRLEALLVAKPFSLEAFTVAVRFFLEMQPVPAGGRP
jgi:CheY-like chemotaxis protein